MITKFKLFESKSSLPKKILNFLDKFPNDATEWKQATDEIRELARFAREIYNDITINVLEEDEKALEPLNFRSFKTPSEWNTKAKEFIISTFEIMNDESKKYFIEYFDSRFE
jgi:hypothetical protein